MAVTLNIVETTTDLGIEVVEVVLASASTPGPAGPGVPTGGTDGQVLTKASATDFDTAWEDATGGAGGAPTTVDYLVGTASGDLSAEIVVGTSPGGELGGTWASPTVDATHSGSSHASVQAAAEATAAAALSAHEADTTSVHGIADTSALETTSGAQAKVDTHVNDATAAHAASAVSADSTTLSGTGTDVQAVLEELDNLLDDHSARHENGGADEISLAGLSGTSEALQAHLDDTADAHDASAISVADAGGLFTATEVEAVLAELFNKAPGRELGYAANTTDQTISATSSPGDLVATLSEITFDGSTTVMFEFFCSRVDVGSSANSEIIVELFDGTSAVTRIAEAGTTSDKWSIYGRHRLTPSSGAHTYNVKAFRVNSNGVLRGSGRGPTFLRAVRV